VVVRVCVLCVILVPIYSTTLYCAVCYFRTCIDHEQFLYCTFIARTNDDVVLKDSHCSTYQVLLIKVSAMTHIPEVLSALFVRNNRRLKNTSRNAAGIAADALTQRTSQRGSLENEHSAYYDIT
jgi:hypothetical protein